MRIKSYVCDFETITEKCMIENNLKNTYVWAAGIMDIDSEKFISLQNIRQFFEFFSTKNSKIYFHNLKFDGKFIIDFLLKNDYTFTIVKNGKKMVNKMEFTTCIDNMGSWYSIEILFENKKGNKKKLTILDSAKKIPLSVKKMAGAYGCHLEKGDIDYDSFRSEHHILTDEEYKYLFNDCYIVAHALKEHFNNGLDKMTISSDAMGLFKQSLHENKEKSLKLFDSLFPALDHNTDTFIRDSYRGGYTYVMDHKRNKSFPGCTYDVNSLYSSIMLKSLLPYGKPITDEKYKSFSSDEKKLYPLYIKEITIEQFELKENKVPIIQIKQTGFNAREYQKNNIDKSGDGYIKVRLTVTNIDWALIKEFYHLVGVKVIKKMWFKGKNNIFKKYIEYWQNIKENSTGGKREIAKLMLNTLYGKFASKIERLNKEPALKNDGCISYHNEYKGDAGKMFYTAMASFITSYSRELTIKAIIDNIDRFIYCDTDSIHLEDFETPILDIHHSKFGAWKLECYFSESKFIRAKSYMEKQYIDNNGEVVTDLDKIDLDLSHWDIKCAGLTKEAKELVTYENFKVGAEFPKKSLKTVPGGCVINDTIFTIKEVDIF